jgi:hypothetical protein
MARRLDALRRLQRRGAAVETHRRRGSRRIRRQGGDHGISAEAEPAGHEHGQLRPIRRLRAARRVLQRDGPHARRARRPGVREGARSRRACRHGRHHRESRRRRHDARAAHARHARRGRDERPRRPAADFPPTDGDVSKAARKTAASARPSTVLPGRCRSSIGAREVIGGQAKLTLVVLRETASRVRRLRREVRTRSTACSNSWAASTSSRSGGKRSARRQDRMDVCRRRHVRRRSMAPAMR